MTDPSPGDAMPLTDLYTRNGFEGPATLLVRRQYTPTYKKVSGDYAPRRLNVWQSQPDSDDARGLPVTVLQAPTVRIDVWNRTQDTPFAIRDVHHDQVLYVLDGHARLETDFGVLDLEPMDMVIVSRAVTFRLAEVRGLRTLVVATANPLHLKPTNEAVLSPAHVDMPRPYDGPPRSDAEHEVVVRHGNEITSFYYDEDPLHVLQTAGAPAVLRFNLGNVNPLIVKGVSSPPAQLIADPTTETLFFYLGAREAGRPPVHHNADYDEIGVYAKGPGALGGIDVPGTAIWVPKGLIHHGPEENVAEGYVAWLVETRAHLELTDAGRRIAHLAETEAFHVHPTDEAE
jgi:homogentisate 1,2-dioxygenase